LFIEYGGKGLKMKRITMVSLLVTIIIGIWNVPCPFAQLAIPDIDTQVAELTKSLNLTEDQVPKVKTILQTNREERQARFEKAREEGLLRDRDAMIKMMQEGQKSLEDELAAVLTEKQLKTYKKNEEIRRANARSRMGRGMGMGR